MLAIGILPLLRFLSLLDIEFSNSVHFLIYPGSFPTVSICESELTLAVHVVVAVLTFIMASIVTPDIAALPVLFVVLVVTNVVRTIVEDLSTRSIERAIVVHAFKGSTVDENDTGWPMHITLFIEVALILYTVLSLV